MGKSLSQYIINYKGLKQGSHTFDFKVGDALFEFYPEGEIKGGELLVTIILQKQSTLMELDVEIEGNVTVPCDRCLEDLLLPLEYKGKLIVKLSQEELPSNDPDVLVLDFQEHELDLTHFFYETISLSLPIKRYHGSKGTSQDDCDPNMLNYLSEQQDDQAPDNEDEDHTIDPRWAKLKDLKN